jgi:3-methyladenine DNA glycosylase AlkD
MTTDFASDFVAFVRAHARAIPPAQSHSETDHVEYFIPVPTMRAFVHDWLAAHPPLLESDWLHTLDTLYHGESLEERMAAGMLLSRHKAHRQRLALARLETWLAQLHGWKEVDTTCQPVFTPAEMFKRWNEWEPFLRQLAARTDVNMRRASLVLLVAVVRSSDDARGIALALTLIQALQHERDKRISKAVSWVLREAVKRHRSHIERYVQDNAPYLPKSSLRDVQTKLDTGKKRI